jgi:SOS-response transcriptional repressor LexA
MNTAEIRRRNLKRLVDDQFGGIQSRFGSAIDRQSDYVSRLLRGKKQLGENLARSIESLLQLPERWLDTEHTSIANEKSQLAESGAGPKSIPVVDWVDLMEWLASGSTSASTQWAPRLGVIRGRACCLIVQNDVMAPEFLPGHTIYVESGREWSNGDFVVALLESQHVPVLRQVVIDGESALLRALNLTYPNAIRPLGSSKVIGRVRHQFKTY